jgi:hypothetical protein
MESRTVEVDGVSLHVDPDRHRRLCGRGARVRCAAGRVRSTTSIDIL